MKRIIQIVTIALLLTGMVGCRNEEPVEEIDLSIGFTNEFKEVLLADTTSSIFIEELSDTLLFLYLGDGQYYTYDLEQGTYQNLTQDFINGLSRQHIRAIKDVGLMIQSEHGFEVYDLSLSLIDTITYDGTIDRIEYEEDRFFVQVQSPMSTQGEVDIYLYDQTLTEVFHFEDISPTYVIQGFYYAQFATKDGMLYQYTEDAYEEVFLTNDFTSVVFHYLDGIIVASGKLESTDSFHTIRTEEGTFDLEENENLLTLGKDPISGDILLFTETLISFGDNEQCTLYTLDGTEHAVFDQEDIQYCQLVQHRYVELILEGNRHDIYNVDGDLQASITFPNDDITVLDYVMQDTYYQFRSSETSYLYDGTDLIELRISSAIRMRYPVDSNRFAVVKEGSSNVTVHLEDGTIQEIETTDISHLLGMAEAITCYEEYIVLTFDYSRLFGIYTYDGDFVYFGKNITGYYVPDEMVILKDIHDDFIDLGGLGEDDDE